MLSSIFLCPVNISSRPTHLHFHIVWPQNFKTVLSGKMRTKYRFCSSSILALYRTFSRKYRLESSGTVLRFLVEGSDHIFYFVSDVCNVFNYLRKALHQHRINTEHYISQYCNRFPFLLLPSRPLCFPPPIHFQHHSPSWPPTPTIPTLQLTLRNLKLQRYRSQAKRLFYLSHFLSSAVNTLMNTTVEVPSRNEISSSRLVSCPYQKRRDSQRTG